MKRLTTLALAIILLTATALPVAAAGCAARYTVKPGDWLKTIGAQFGVDWRDIATANNISNANIIYVGQVLCIPEGATSASTTTTTTTAATATTASGKPVPTFSILSVIAGQSVTIQTANFPANLTFNVLMGPLGTRGEAGVVAGTFQSGAGGALTTTVSIPASLRGSGQIAIRTESQTTKHFSYNWFFNR